MNGIIPTYAMRRKEIIERSNEVSDFWGKHSIWHWYKDIGGKRLDYWPSTGKWKYDGVVYKNGLQKFLRKMM